MWKNIKIFFSGFIVAGLIILYACSTDKPQPTEPENTPLVPGKLGFSIINQTDTVVTLQVSWTVAQDAYGKADSYIHTMTSSKIVTDSITGQLPSNKSTVYLADTVQIRVSLISDTVTLTSKVWSVRRGITSTQPAIASALIKRGFGSITIDTSIVRLIWGVKSGVTQYGICCGPALQGPWLDTIFFYRQYNQFPPRSVLQRDDSVWYDPSYSVDTSYVKNYRHPLIKFSFSKPNIIRLAVDSNTAVFQVLDSSNKSLYIIASYNNNQIRDSLFVITQPGGKCQPWPTCYYTPGTVTLPIPPTILTFTFPDTIP